MRDVLVLCVQLAATIGLSAWVVRRDVSRLGPELVCPRTGRGYGEVGPERLDEIIE